MSVKPLLVIASPLVVNLNISRYIRTISTPKSSFPANFILKT